MDDSKTVKIDELRAAIARAGYTVDADAVAGALLARLAAVEVVRRLDVHLLLDRVEACALAGGVHHRCS